MSSNTILTYVPSGIEAATLDLQKENEERLWQEGLLRQVPVVGSFVNWWSPRGKEGGIKGRSLNLNAGMIMMLLTLSLSTINYWCIYNTSCFRHC